MKHSSFFIVLDGRCFVMQAPPHGAMHEIGWRFREAAQLGTRHSARFFIDFLLRVLRDAYPEIDRDFIAGALDLNGMGVVQAAIDCWVTEAHTDAQQPLRIH